MTRYYYTDPLAAAWMMDKFGMMFCTQGGAKAETEDYGTLLSVAWDRYYIHPKSVKLLKPKQWDIVECEAINFGIVLDVYKGMVGVQYSTNEKLETIIGEEYLEDVKVIQRNEIAFMQPKVEE